MNKNVLVAGASGLVGQHLIVLLKSKGYTVKTLGRGKQSDYHWDPINLQIDENTLQNVDVIINLSGANVADHRWTKDFKNEIYDSRIYSNRLLFQLSKRTGNVPALYITASAIGIYNNSKETINEHSELGSDFLADTCCHWEQEAVHFESLGSRTSAVRTGIVLAKEGGFLPRIASPIKWGIGAGLGNGQQMTSWIHVDDLCSIFIYIIEHSELRGAINAVAPKAESNIMITKAIAKKINRKILLPNVPAWVLRILFGEFATELLSDKNVVPEKLLMSGFKYRFKNISDALDNLYTDRRL